MVLYFLLLTLRSYALQYTISGFDSGASFAVQMHIAYSLNITGAGVVAPAPYYCSLGSRARYHTACSINPYLTSLAPLTQFATDAATLKQIDDVKNIQNDRVYLFSGSLDTITLPTVANQTDAFYRTFIHNNYQMNTVYNISAQHAWVTNMYGNPCWANSSPGINNCNYDMAEALLSQLLGNLIPKGTQLPSNLIPFDQSNYADIWQAGLSTRGWVYLPQYCITHVCDVHLCFHGCNQNYDLIGNIFIKETGLNEWAETNDIIVIYPQTITTQDNRRGCWDVWGYTGSNFTYQSGLQMSFANAVAQNPPFVKWT